MQLQKMSPHIIWLTYKLMYTNAHSACIASRYHFHSAPGIVDLTTPNRQEIKEKEVCLINVI